MGVTTQRLVALAARLDTSAKRAAAHHTNGGRKGTQLFSRPFGRFRSPRARHRVCSSPEKSCVPFASSGRYGGEHPGLGFRYLAPAPQRTVRPCFCPSSQPRAERISLHVTTNNQEMVVIGNGKTLEAGLIQVPLPRSVIMRVITLGVRGVHPAQHAAHSPVLGGSQDHVPMVGHERERKQLDRVAFESFAAPAKTPRNPVCGRSTVEHSRDSAHGRSNPPRPHDLAGARQLSSQGKSTWG